MQQNNPAATQITTTTSNNRRTPLIHINQFVLPLERNTPHPFAMKSDAGDKG
jgi:hypothetical protein